MKMKNKITNENFRPSKATKVFNPKKYQLYVAPDVDLANRIKLKEKVQQYAAPDDSQISQPERKYTSSGLSALYKDDISKDEK